MSGILQILLGQVLQGPAPIGLFAGGYTGAYSNVIDSVNISTVGNATDFGDLTQARDRLAGVASTIRGVFGGGNT